MKLFHRYHEAETPADALVNWKYADLPTSYVTLAVIRLATWITRRRSVPSFDLDFDRCHWWCKLSIGFYMVWRAENILPRFEPYAWWTPIEEWQL